MNSAIPATIIEIKTACSQCNLRELCLPFGLDPREINQLDELVGSRRKIKRQQHLYRSGESFEAIYAIRAGSFKTDVILEDGRDQVTGFQMTGEILGIDGIGSGLHACKAVALEASEVCMMPYGSVEELASNLPNLHAHLNKLMSQRIVQDQSTFQILANLRSESRLAAFLLDLGKRFSALGYSPNTFVLRMTREEIGSYLGLSLETVSRLFSRFQEDGLVDVQTRHLQITQPEALADMASGKASH